MSNSSRDPKERFSSRVDAYVAARPRYPQEVVDHLKDAIKFTRAWTVADVGSGTGISTELFLQNGNTVFAVEPNAAMRGAAENLLAKYPNFRSIDGSAEATTLMKNSIDLVVAAQAFHWFDIEATRKEFIRLLRPGGWALLMWNDRKLTGSPFLEAYEKLLVDFGTDYLKVRHNNISSEKFAEFFQTGGSQSAGFENQQTLDFEGLRARVLSSSYMPPAEHPTHGAMLAALRALFEAHQENGQITIEYETTLTYGQFG